MHIQVEYKILESKEELQRETKLEKRIEKCQNILSNPPSS